MEKINIANNKQKQMWDFDMSLKDDYYDYVCGCDESGRGAIASVIVGAAVILKPEAAKLQINDSKKLEADAREDLFQKIIENSIAYHIELLNSNYIDSKGIQQANICVLSRARYLVTNKLPKMSKIVTIMDGNSLWSETNLLWEPHGDAKSLSIAAASILAKVYRDRIMVDLDAEYPDYWFAQHKGYGTAIHKKLIRQYGKIDGIHRLTFTRDIPDNGQFKLHGF